MSRPAKQYTAKMLRNLVTKLEDRHRHPDKMTLAEWFDACAEWEAFLIYLARQDRAAERLSRYSEDELTQIALAYIRDHMDYAVSRIVRDLDARGVEATAEFVARTRRLIFDSEASFEAFQLQKSKR